MNGNEFIDWIELQIAHANASLIFADHSEHLTDNKATIRTLEKVLTKYRQVSQPAEQRKEGGE